jgi:hypothetical protein
MRFLKGIGKAVGGLLKGGVGGVLGKVSPVLGAVGLVGSMFRRPPSAPAPSSQEQAALQQQNELLNLQTDWLRQHLPLAKQGILTAMGALGWRQNPATGQLEYSAPEAQILEQSQLGAALNRQMSDQIEQLRRMGADTTGLAANLGLRRQMALAQTAAQHKQQSGLAMAEMLGNLLNLSQSSVPSYQMASQLAQQQFANRAQQYQWALAKDAWRQQQFGNMAQLGAGLGRLFGAQQYMRTLNRPTPPPSTAPLPNPFTQPIDVSIFRLRR